MTFFVLDRIGFLKSSDYNFRELPSDAAKAKAWLEVNNPNWLWYIEDPKTQDQLRYLLGMKSLPWERKHGALPVLGPEDAALIIYRDPVPGTKPETTPSHVQDPWRYGLLSGSKLS